MKLQGKTTGALAGFIGYVSPSNPTTIDLPSGEPMLTVRYKDAGANCYKDYKTIAEFSADWEDYKPTYPLIKDRNHPERAEKARRTLKMWADANDFKRVSYRVDSCVSVFYNECNPAECATQIEFGWIMEGLKPGIYDITELCGEEEEK